LRGHLDPRHGRIFSDVADLVDLDARFAGERRLQLFCERGRFGVAAWKTAYEAGKLWLRQIGREVNAGNTGTCQQLRETFFTSGCAEWHTVEQNLIPRGSQQ
jgi:bifunctional pyridoxal-dependent enzyme with beta-cystathionase and maltose regulon repressor activities